MEVTPTEAVLADQNGDFKHVYNLSGSSGYRKQSKQIRAPKKSRWDRRFQKRLCGFRSLEPNNLTT